MISDQWRITVASLGALLLLQALLWFETLAHISSILWSVDVFAHGLLAPIVSVVLIWSRRKSLLECKPQSSWFGALIVLGAALMWLAGELLDVALIRHLAFVTAIQGSVFCAMGLDVYRRILFPMLFLYFSVPFGYELVGPLQLLTANLVINALDLIGANYSAEGMLITLPSGLYEVAEACAGVKFLFTSLFTGVLLAHLVFESWSRRIGIVLVSVLLPVVANAVRVLLIFLIAELSDQKLAKGFDHLVYGWVFLSIVLFLLISVAYRYSDKSLGTAENHTDNNHRESLSPEKFSVSPAIAAFISVLIVSFLVPSRSVGDDLTVIAEPTPLLENSTSDFRILINTNLIARPQFISASEIKQSLLRYQGVVFHAYLAKFDRLSSGNRLFQPGNSLIPDEWKTIETRVYLTVINGCTLPVQEYEFKRAGRTTLVWATYFVGPTSVKNAIGEKLTTALLSLQRKPSTGKVIVLTGPVAGELDSLRSTFEQFLSTFALDSDLTTSGGHNTGIGSLCAE